VKASINANHANFTDFDSVKDAYVEFKCTDPLTNDPKTQQVASVARGGHGGGDYPHRYDRGHGSQTSDKCQKRLVPQSEVNKQTHIVNRHYDDAEFNQLTPAEKQKLWQLRNAGKTPGTGPTRRNRRRAVASSSTSSISSGGSSKRQMEDPAIKSDQPAADHGAGTVTILALAIRCAHVAMTTHVPHPKI
jgi:hypothetical protein